MSLMDHPALLAPGQDRQGIIHQEVSNGNGAEDREHLHFGTVHAHQDHSFAGQFLNSDRPYK